MPRYRTVEVTISNPHNTGNTPAMETILEGYRLKPRYGRLGRGIGRYGPEFGYDPSLLNSAGIKLGQHPVKRQVA
jgi:hypothetical protein